MHRLCLSPIFFKCINMLPLELTEKMSDYELLMYLCKKINEAIHNLNNLNSTLNLTVEEVNQLKLDVAELEKTVEDVKNGKYVGLYLDSLKNYIDNNLISFVADLVKYVFFGLTDDGHFAAYIPDSWKFINFDTIIDPNSENYGRLLLYY